MRNKTRGGRGECSRGLVKMWPWFYQTFIKIRTFGSAKQLRECLPDGVLGTIPPNQYSSTWQNKWTPRIPRRQQPYSPRRFQSGCKDVNILIQFDVCCNEVKSKIVGWAEVVGFLRCKHQAGRLRPTWRGWRVLRRSASATEKQTHDISGSSDTSSRMPKNLSC